MILKDNEGTGSGGTTMGVMHTGRSLVKTANKQENKSQLINTEWNEGEEPGVQRCKRAGYNWTEPTPKEIGISRTAYKAMYEKLINHFVGENVINNAIMLGDLDTASV